MGRNKDSELIAFISGSFANEAEQLIEWFIAIIERLGIQTIWLKRKYESRPAEEKIKRHLKNCNMFIQIWSKEITQSKEAGWIGNEIAWADSYGIRRFIIFVEEGMETTGIAKVKADNLIFNRKNLGKVVHEIMDFILDVGGIEMVYIPEVNGRTREGFDWFKENTYCCPRCGSEHHIARENLPLIITCGGKLSPSGDSPSLCGQRFKCV